MERFWQIVAKTRKERAVKWGSKRWAPVFFWCLFATFCIASKCNPTKAEDPARATVNLFNQERKTRGVPPLTLEKSLCAYATKHAEKMALRKKLYHSSMKEFQKYSAASSVSENIATGRDPEWVVDNWMFSSEHRKNILGKSYKKVGVGTARSPDGKIYWCAVFAA